jgi:putative protein-disulfide isomerase
MKLIYVGDPMCSWCYGFGKEMTALRERRPDIPLEIVVGGLRAGGTDVLDDAGKRFRLHHWAQVEQASGLPFNRAGLIARKGFVYDTEPICRAVVTARILAPDSDLLPVFRALQRAFYVDALDTTDGEVLAKAGAAALGEVGFSIEPDDFLAVWRRQSTIDAARADFANARSMGVTSFPALFLEQDGKLRSVSPGYTHVESLEQALSSLGAPAEG